MNDGKHDYVAGCPSETLLEYLIQAVAVGGYAEGSEMHPFYRAYRQELSKRLETATRLKTEQRLQELEHQAKPKAQLNRVQELLLLAEQQPALHQALNQLLETWKQAQIQMRMIIELDADRRDYAQASKHQLMLDVHKIYLDELTIVLKPYLSQPLHR